MQIQMGTLFSVLPTAIMWRAFRDLLRMCVPELGWLCHSPSIRGMTPTSWSFRRYATHSSANLVMSSSACSISSICHPQHLVMRPFNQTCSWHFKAHTFAADSKASGLIRKPKKRNLKQYNWYQHLPAVVYSIVQNEGQTSPMKLGWAERRQRACEWQHSALSTLESSASVPDLDVVLCFPQSGHSQDTLALGLVLDTLQTIAQLLLGHMSFQTPQQLDPSSPAKPEIWHWSSLFLFSPWRELQILTDFFAENCCVWSSATDWKRTNLAHCPDDLCPESESNQPFFDRESYLFC